MAPTTTTATAEDESKAEEIQSAEPTSISSLSELDLSTTTAESVCICGERLCGADCHLRQQESEVATRRVGVANDAKNGSSNNSDTQDIADLERLRRRFASASAFTGFDDTCIDDIIVSPSDAESSSLSHRDLRRTKSCVVHSFKYDKDHVIQRNNAFRLRIGYHDEGLRERCRLNTQLLLQRAVSDSSDTPSTATILARKALKYRKILERMEGVDINDPSFDMLESLGVRWQRVSPPE